MTGSSKIRVMRRVILACTLAVMLTAAPARMQQPREQVDVSDLGPQVGETIPDFSLPDQNGTVWTRESIVGTNGAMIVFHRSADW